MKIFFLLPLLALLLPCSAYAWNNQNVELFKAIQNIDVGKVKELIKSGVDVNAYDPEEYIRIGALDAAWSAIRKNFKPEQGVLPQEREMFNLLVASGAKPQATYGVAGVPGDPVYERTARIERDLGHCIVCVEGRMPTTDLPLIAAVQEGHSEEVAHLIKKGANVNEKDLNGSTALMWAAKCDPQLTDILIKAGADVKTKDKFSNTPLHWALSEPDTCEERSCEKQTEIIKSLLNAGVDVNAKDIVDQTPLMYAINAEGACSEVIKALIDAGADVNAMDIHALTPLFLAVIKEKADTIEMLIKAGADINAKPAGYTALMLAVEKGIVLIVESLLAGHADANIPDSNGRTALMRAKKTQIIKQLLKAGADVNAKDDMGMTALMIAAGAGRPKVVKKLVSLGADVLAQDNRGETALNKALSSYIDPKSRDRSAERAEIVNFLSKTIIEKYPDQTARVKDLLARKNAPQEIQSWTDWIKQNVALTGATAISSVVALAALWWKYQKLMQPIPIMQPAQVVQPVHAVPQAQQEKG